MLTIIVLGLISHSKTTVWTSWSVWLDGRAGQ